MLKSNKIDFILIKNDKDLEMFVTILLFIDLKRNRQ